MKKDSTEINSYILDEDTRRKINNSNFTLGDGKLREMHDRHHARMKKVQDLAASLGVEYEPCLPEPTNVLKKVELIQKYHENKEMYDRVLNEVLTVCTPEEVLEFIEKQLKQP